MSESEEPDWRAELAKGGDEVRRQIDLLVQGAQQFVRGTQQGPAADGPVPPFQQRVVRAVGAAMRELAPMSGYPIRYGGFKGYASAAVAVTGSGSVALPPSRAVASGDVITVTETAAVRVVPDRPNRLAALSDGQIAFLVLVWLYAVWLPWVGSRLPPELHGMLTDSYATVALALTITWRMLDKRK